MEEEVKVEVPSIITVGPFSYAVKLQEGLALMTGNVGEHRVHTREIVIDSGTTIKDAVLLHEIIHAINFTYVIEMDDSSIDRLAHGLLEVLNDMNITMNWNRVG